MRKEELVGALLSAGPKKARANPASVSGKSGQVSRQKSAAQKRLSELQERRRQLNDLSTPIMQGKGQRRDRLVVFVRDPYWLHLCWELDPSSIERAKKSVAQRWHGASPVIRVRRIAENGDTALLKSVPIHGGVSNWYIDVDEPPARFRAEIGYATADGGFYCLARSNEVKTPAPGSSDAIDENWIDVARNADRIYAMSGGYSQGGASLELQELLEERLRRRLGRPTETRFGNGASPRDEEDQMPFALDAELIIYGSTTPNTHVTVQGEPVAVQQDGAFAVKLPFPDRRQVVPVVASSADGLDQKTIILGIERNTKALDNKRIEPGGGK